MYKIKNLYFNQVSVTDFFSFIFYAFSQRNNSTIELRFIGFEGSTIALKYPLHISLYFFFVCKIFYRISILYSHTFMKFLFPFLLLTHSSTQITMAKQYWNAFVWFHPFVHKNIAFNNFMDSSRKALCAINSNIFWLHHELSRGRYWESVNHFPLFLLYILCRNETRLARLRKGEKKLQMWIIFLVNVTRFLFYDSHVHIFTWIYLEDFFFVLKCCPSSKCERVLWNFNKI